MKKIFCFIIVLFIIFGVSCKKKTEILPVKEKNKIVELDNRQQTEFSSVDDDIDKKLLSEINMTYHNLVKKGIENIEISIESLISEDVASYLVKYQYEQNCILKAYNYAISSKNLMVLNQKELVDRLNHKHMTKYQFTEEDVGFINYTIDYKEIHIYLSEHFFGCTEEIILPFDNNMLEKGNITTPKIEKKVALTFDDGPSLWSKELVDLLDELDVVATFFVLGSNVAYYPDELKYIASHGHEIGNHSYSHPNFKKITIDMGLDEIQKTQDIIFQTIHRYPRVFRFPYGSIQKEVLKNTHLRSILWTADSLDWREFNFKMVVENVEKEIKNDGVILFHDFRFYNEKAITQVVKDLKEEGYVFVTISELYSFYSDEDFIEEKNYF